MKYSFSTYCNPIQLAPHLVKLKLEKQCKAGNRAELEKWWAENGHKTRDEPATEAPCFEAFELHLQMDSLINKADDLLKQLTEHNSKK